MKFRRFIYALLIIMILLTGCRSSGLNIQNEIEIEDAFGRIVAFSGKPQRIIIAGKQTPMLANFFYLFDSASEKIFAIENRTQRANQFLTLIDPNLESKLILEKGAGGEQIAPLNPDAVILKTSMRESVGNQLEQIGIPVIYVEFESIDQIYRDVRMIAELLKESSRGEEIISIYEEFYSEISNEIDGLPNESVLLVEIVDDAGGYTISVPAENWLQTDLVRRAEGNPVWIDSVLGGGWSEINFEQITVWNPDHIFVVNYQGNAPTIVEKLRTDELWKNLNATKNNHIVAFPNDYISWDQPDPRWILGYSFLANRLHPEAISDEILDEKIITFYKLFYGLDEVFIKENILTMIKQ